MTDPHERIDTSKPHSARMYDYYLGGKDWFEVDRHAANAVIATYPTVLTAARANRAFMHRAVRTLAAEYGVRQFLDVGTGIPTKPNLHQVAQAVAPECRVVYADNDPLVLEYADALLRSSPEGRTVYVDADVREDAIVDAPEVREVLDLDMPVALSLVALMHFVPDDADPYGLVRRLMEPLPSGSFLVLSHVTDDFASPEDTSTAESLYSRGGTSLRMRSRKEIGSFFDGLDLLPPGLVTTHRWRADASAEMEDADVGFLAGVARKP
ncbi:SAM-dependent methyltransferase [Streptomyces xiaopingdaonensis]|uniref:SAM-dependent methyltransferase n=1 Tax=Streptomyces xiaopingdaonensis TaxID=1565415 RepID=UPI0002F67E90|nr:SAM-dependent methyltransferase [Streptomyces xiaopingdaonensis]